jgi:hypothetical protein
VCIEEEHRCGAKGKGWGGEKTEEKRESKGKKEQMHAYGPEG